MLSLWNVYLSILENICQFLSVQIYKRGEGYKNAISFSVFCNVYSIKLSVG